MESTFTYNLGQLLHGKSTRQHVHPGNARTKFAQLEIPKIRQLPLHIQHIAPHTERIHFKPYKVRYRIGPLDVRQQRRPIGNAGVEFLGPQLDLGQWEGSTEHVGDELAQPRFDEAGPGLGVGLGRSHDAER